MTRRCKCQIEHFLLKKDNELDENGSSVGNH